MTGKEFKNKVVVITGGASGIGWAAALAFAKAGASVALVGRSRAKLNTAAKILLAISPCLTVAADVSDFRQARAAVKKVLSKFKRVDVLVNCAGILGPVGETAKVSAKDWQKTIAINLLGTVHMAMAVLPKMAKQKSGKIINMSGGGAVQPRPNFSAYAVSKAAVVRLTENLAREYEKYHIQVNSIAPGAINTKFLAETLKAGKKAGDSEFYAALKQKQSGGDSAELAAELILFLCSTKSHNLTGKLISVKWDGWKTFSKKIVDEINRNSSYTLRRIDNKYFYESH